MKLYKLIIYRLAKKDTPLAIIERIRHAFNTSDIDHHDTKFFISDSQHSVSGIDRLLIKIPDLDHFRYSVGTSDDFEQRLSNLSVRWEGANPKRFTNSLGMGDLIEIVGGIPRRYPLNKLTVIFDNIPILRRNPIDSKDEPIPFIAKGDVGYTRLFSPSVTGGGAITLLRV
ncbi:hypothetical protein [Paenibacillus albus]|uniref:Uncharacterized protein n=1 Tax=Paenibacillus albus TaxID=2495582 RepID=A0A3Q8X6G2_9BACL|nr:hypothetical protein [Paenibacillus albus]AZN41547.1 hypothetical protein EJC50_19080 [Paenibacillus albus]